jgi:hypothetical protein
LFDSLYAKPWVVYAKRPFGGPKQVVEYLGRYTHKIAISNHRLQAIGEGKVLFGYKDNYRQQGRKRSMELTYATGVHSAVFAASFPRALCASGTTAFWAARQRVSVCLN